MSVFSILCLRNLTNPINLRCNNRIELLSFWYVRCMYFVNGTFAVCTSGLTDRRRAVCAHTLSLPFTYLLPNILPTFLLLLAAYIPCVLLLPPSFAHAHQPGPWLRPLPELTDRWGSCTERALASNHWLMWRPKKKKKPVFFGQTTLGAGRSCSSEVAAATQLLRVCVSLYYIHTRREGWSSLSKRGGTMTWDESSPPFLLLLHNQHHTNVMNRSSTEPEPA